MLEQHRYLFLHLHHVRSTKSTLHSLTGWCMYNTNRVYSVAPGLRCVPPYKSRHPSRFSSTRSAHLHSLARTSSDILLPPTPKNPKPRENVPQRWFFVFVYFSQRRLTNFRSSTDASTPPAVISSVCRPACKTATGRIACSAGGTSTPLVSTVFRTPTSVIYSPLVFSRHRMQVIPVQKVGLIGFFQTTGKLTRLLT